MKNKIREYVFSELSEYFKLDENSPSGLVRIRNKYDEIIKEYSVGTRSYRKNGNPAAWIVRFKGNNYFIHRIIWVLTHGNINSQLVIDHLDGDPFNNSIDNLILKTTQNNSRNVRKYVQTDTGITGVCLNVKSNNRLYYRAGWNDLDGSKNFKHFSVKKFGEIEALRLAIKYREEQIQRLITEGADYTARHGK